MTTHPFSHSQWIWSADQGDPRFTVRRFRGTFATDIGQKITVNVSADSRYVLYLDGSLIGRGPAKSDVRHYNYESYELEIPAGKHVLAAIVVAFQGSSCPISEMHEQGAFLLEAQNESHAALISTKNGANWTVHADAAYKPAEVAWLDGYYGIGATEVVDGTRIPQGWNEVDFDDSGWDLPRDLYAPYLRERSPDMADPGGRWRLMPRDIPTLRDQSCVFTESITETVGARSHWERIVEAPSYSIGYPVLKLSGGAGATIQLMYAEAKTKDGAKGTRDNPDGDVVGFFDTYLAGGGIESYSPLHWRAFRFIKLIIDTAEAPLQIAGFTFMATGYPWDRCAQLVVEDGPDELQDVMDIDFRTLSCCTTETFMDCPYYEQLQYIGDSRLQALLSYVTTGDTRLGARAVRQFDWSRLPEGLTQSRYPSRMDQVIPTFSLIWVLMVEDLFRYSPGDVETVASCLSGCRSVLEWFDSRLNQDGLLGGNLPWWNFVDWAKEWDGGVPTPIADGQPSSTVNLQFLAAIQAYVRLSRCLGAHAEADRWLTKAANLSGAINAVFWDENLDLLREGPSPKWGYSQHAQAWGILTGSIPKGSEQSVVNSLRTDDRLIKATYYQIFYVVEALAMVRSLDDLWDKWLAPWRTALSLHLSTWPEQPEPTRSDCHAWSAWPTYAFLTHVLGYSPGSDTCDPKRVAGWNKLTGTVPTSDGKLLISVSWDRGTAAWTRTFV